MTHHPKPAELQARLEAIQRRIRHHIDTVGWAVINTWLTCAEGDHVPFSYTVGHTERERPEICIVGLDPSLGQSFLNSLSLRTIGRDSANLRHGLAIAELSDPDMILVEGPATGIIQPTIALNLYGLDRVRLQQCVWPDLHGVFPWQPGYSMPVFLQPVIATPS